MILKCLPARIDAVFQSYKQSRGEQSFILFSDSSLATGHYGSFASRRLSDTKVKKKEKLREIAKDILEGETRQKLDLSSSRTCGNKEEVRFLMHVDVFSTSGQPSICFSPIRGTANKTEL